MYKRQYLLIPTLLVEITIRVPWFAERSNISSLGDFHGYIFIFYAFQFFVVGYILVMKNTYNDEKVIINQIFYAKRSKCVSKLVEFISSHVNSKDFKDEKDTLQHSFRNLYYKTTSDYYRSIDINYDPRKLTLKHHIWTIFLTINIMLIFAALDQINITGIDVLIVFISITFGSWFGYKMGKHFGKTNVIYPILVLKGLINHYFLKNNMSFDPSEDYEDRELRTYDPTKEILNESTD